MAAQRGYDVYDRVTRIALVNPITLCDKVAGRWFDGVSSQGTLDVTIDDRSGERVELGSSEGDSGG